MLTAMLDAHAVDFVDAARKDWSDGDELLLERLASEDVEPWGDAPLAEISQPVILAWLRKNGPSPRIATMLLQAWKPKQLARVPVAEWNALEEEGGHLSDFALALLFAVASDPESDLGPRRAVRTYNEVFRRTAGGGTLTKRALKVLAERSGSKTGLSARDLATRMISRAFRSEKWQAAYLLQIEDADALRQVLAHDPSGALVEKLVPALSRGDAPRAQRDVIFEALLATENHAVIQSAWEFVRKYIPWL